MVFRGLFVGIDRYRSPQVPELRSAVRDATAMHALFADTFAADPSLLTDDSATCGGIRAAIGALAASTADDFVVIYFSGHGTPTHELVPYDADGANHAGTFESLEDLGALFSRIRARQIVCILDCCFSGGMGAKVFLSDIQARDFRLSGDPLDELAGSGRVVFTASGAKEPAYEVASLGHGILTHHLLTALQGADEVRDAGKLPLLRLLEFVTTRVIDSAAAFGKEQHPTIRGQVDGRVEWPVFVPGSRYRAAFPERTRPIVTTDIQSLSGYGFAPDLLGAWARAIPSLNQLQVDAVNDFGILTGDHLVVSAPTSSGKTLIGELAALKGVIEGKRALFLLPLKALAYDKQAAFARIYGPYGVRTVCATGETDDVTQLLRGRYDIALLTYEKFSGLAVGAPFLLDQVGTIVVDEAQMIADESRGANLEFLLTLIRSRRSRGTNPQLVLLSAVIGDSNGLERWLGARLLRRVERPVPLDEGVLRGDGSFRYIDGDTSAERATPALFRPLAGKGSSQDLIIPLVRRLVADGQQVIVFRETKGEARGCAKYLAAALGLPAAVAARAELPTGDPSLASDDLRQTLAGGVAFHTSDLDRGERLAVEEAFRAPGTTLRVIAATTTLAMGVNTPASAVVIAGLDHPGPHGGTVPYSIAEYKNMVGRAGRLGLSTRGTSYLLAASSSDEHSRWVRYVRGAPEDLVSRFLMPETDARTLVVRVLAAAQRLSARGMTPDNLTDFLEGSFGAFIESVRRPAWKWDRAHLAGALDELTQHGLVERTPDGTLALTELGAVPGESGVEIGSIVRVVRSLTGLDPSHLTDPTLITVTQLTDELDAVAIPLNRRSTQKEPTAWPQELRLQGVPPGVLAALRFDVTESAQATLRAKRAVACLLWVTERPLIEIEGRLTQFGGALGGAAGALRQVTARTVDVLPTVMRVAEILHPTLRLGARQSRLLLRLELGIPSTAADLAGHLRTALTRGEYLALTQARLVGLEELAAASDDEILACVGRNVSKLTAVRDAVDAWRDAVLPVASEPILPPYQP